MVMHGADLFSMLPVTSVSLSPVTPAHAPMTVLDTIDPVAFVGIAWTIVGWVSKEEEEHTVK